MQHWQRIEQELKSFIKQEMKTDPAHDLNHVDRVVKMAKRLAKNEHGELNVVIPAAYLHDCVSLPKNHPQRSQSSILAAEKAIEFLATLNYPVQYFAGIKHAIASHSFSAQIAAETIEAKIVQDADRLDAIGSIGIARCIQVSSQFDSQLYSHDDPFCQHRVPDDKAFTVDHFYVKLFKICDTLHTPSAIKEGAKRKAFMQAFMAQLGSEI